MIRVSVFDDCSRWESGRWVGGPWTGDYYFPVCPRKGDVLCIEGYELDVVKVELHAGEDDASVYCTDGFDR